MTMQYDSFRPGDRVYVSHPFKATVAGVVVGYAGRTRYGAYYVPCWRVHIPGKQSPHPSGTWKVRVDRMQKMAKPKLLTPPKVQEQELVTWQSIKEICNWQPELEN